MFAPNNRYYTAPDHYFTYDGISVREYDGEDCCTNTETLANFHENVRHLYKPTFQEWLSDNRTKLLMMAFFAYIFVLSCIMLSKG